MNWEKRRIREAIDAIKVDLKTAVWQGSYGGSGEGVQWGGSREGMAAWGRHIDSVGVISLLLRARGNSAINNNTDGFRE